MSIDAREMTPLEKVRRQEKLRHDLLNHIMNTPDLEGLHEHVYNVLQAFGEYADETPASIMRREVSGTMEQRLLRCITMFVPADKGQSSDPVWLLEAIENLGTEERNYNLLERRITQRLCGDIVYFPENAVTESIDYFYDMAAALEIKLDDKKIEDAVYYRAERKLERSSGYKDVVLVSDFLKVNLPVGRACVRQTPTTIHVAFEGERLTLDLI